MVAINTKEIYRFEVRPLKRFLCKVGSAWLCNQRRPLTLKEKISGKGHFIDELSDYKFIKCSELNFQWKKKTFFYERWVFIFFYPRKSRPGTRYHENPQVLVTERSVIWNDRFKCPVKLRTIESVEHEGLMQLNIFCSDLKPRQHDQESLLLRAATKINFEDQLISFVRAKC